MFSPSDLQGEVDHAFFDSDLEDVRGEEGKKADTKMTDSLLTSSQMQPNQALSTKTTLRDETLSVSSVNDNNGSEGKSDSKEESHSPKSSKPFMALIEAKDTDENESEKDSHSKVKNEQKNKKQIPHFRPSSASSETNRDTESITNNSDTSNSASKTSSSRVKGTTSSATSREAHSVSSYEFDDTVTTVSPLSSATSSRLQLLDLNHSETEEDKSGPSSGRSSAQHQKRFSKVEDDYSLNSMSQLRGNVVMQFHDSRHRKNYSFTNSEVKRIDRDNQRLLQHLSRLSSRPRPDSVVGQRDCVTASTPVNRFPHSLLNRQRELQRIERDNLAFFKRLQSVKPTPGIKRTEQLADYQRQLGYLGLVPVYQTNGKDSSSRVSLGKDHIQDRAPHHTTRTTSRATESTSTPVPRPRKTKAQSPWS